MKHHTDGHPFIWPVIIRLTITIIAATLIGVSGWAVVWAEEVVSTAALVGESPLAAPESPLAPPAETPPTATFEPTFTPTVAPTPTMTPTFTSTAAPTIPATASPTAIAPEPLLVSPAATPTILSTDTLTNTPSASPTAVATVMLTAVETTSPTASTPTATPTSQATVDFTLGGVLPTVTPTPVETIQSAEGEEVQDSEGELRVRVVQSPAFALRLTGQEQTAYGRMTIEVLDLRAAKTGWHLQMGLLPMANSAQGHTLTGTELSLTDVQIVCGQVTCMRQSAEPAWATPISQSWAGDERVRVLSFPPNGDTSMTITIGLSLRLPADVYSGQYLIRPLVDAAAGGEG